jgi:UDP-2,3-diacylglucosamine hydrolase
VRSVFLGDAHLGHAPGPVHQQVIEFVDGLAADRLFLLGDLFDFLVGLGGAAPAHADPVLAALTRAADRGVAVIYVEGNHDFHLRPLLDPRIVVWPGPGDVDLGQTRVHLAHGDEIQRSDPGYAILRPLIRSAPLITAARLAGSALVHRLGRGSAETSRSLRAGRSRDWRAEKLRYVRRRIETGCDLVVLGHSHQLFTEQVGAGWVLQVGRFDRREQHAVLDGRRLQLREGRRLVFERDI